MSAVLDQRLQVVPLQRKGIVIGGRHFPGERIHMNTRDGVFEAMSPPMGSNAEAVQRALLQPIPADVQRRIDAIYLMRSPRFGQPVELDSQLRLTDNSKENP